MIPVKKLADILQDAYLLTADFAQRYRDVQIRFVCYRNKQPVHQSASLSPAHLQTELSHQCRHFGATRVQLIINGTGLQREPVQLYNETFRLARAGHQSVKSGGYGPGNPMMPQPMMPVLYQGSYGGGAGSLGGLGDLGAADLNAVMEKKLYDELLSRDHAALQKEAEEMRRRMKGLEDEVAALEATAAATNKIKEYSDMLAPFAPIISSYLGGNNAMLGQALGGLGGTQAEDGAGDSQQTKMVMGMVRQFMTGLSDAHREQLLSVMMRIRQDTSLITHIARFIHRPPQQ